MDNIPDMDDLLDSLEYTQTTNNSSKNNVKNVIDYDKQSSNVQINYKQNMEDAEEKFYMNIDGIEDNHKNDDVRDVNIDVNSDTMNLNDKLETNNDKDDVNNDKNQSTEDISTEKEVNENIESSSSVDNDKLDESDQNDNEHENNDVYNCINELTSDNVRGTSHDDVITPVNLPNKEPLLKENINEDDSINVIHSEDVGNVDNLEMMKPITGLIPTKDDVNIVKTDEMKELMTKELNATVEEQIITNDPTTLNAPVETEMITEVVPESVTSIIEKEEIEVEESTTDEGNDGQNVIEKAQVIVQTLGEVESDEQVLNPVSDGIENVVETDRTDVSGMLLRDVHNTIEEPESNTVIDNNEDLSVAVPEEQQNNIEVDSITERYQDMPDKSNLNEDNPEAANSNVGGLSEDDVIENKVDENNLLTKADQNVGSTETDKSEPMPVSFNEMTELTPEEEEELQKELESMPTENAPDVADDEPAEEKDQIIEGNSEKIQTETETPPAVDSASSNEQRQKPSSVILSTHDLSYFNDNPVLTESELQLGKTKPYWIPDDDCNSCMICSTKFTVINRRHHCRCCGRVLCNSCCNIKRPLPYIEDSDKKQKVCEPCSRTLDRIEEYETHQASMQNSEGHVSQEQSSAIDIPTENVEPGPGPSSIRGYVAPSSLRKKSVLKSKKTEGTSPEESDNIRKRSVKFLDGVNPGHEDDAGSSRTTVEEDSEGNKRKTQKRQSSSRRHREKRIEEEQVSLIKDDCLYVTDCDSQLSKMSIDTVCKMLVDGERITIAIRKNFWVVTELIQTLSGKVWCFTTRGMAFIGTDELLLSFESNSSDIEHLQDVVKFYELKKEKENDDQSKYPKETFIHSVLYLFEHFFIESLIPSNDNIDEKIGIRKCGTRMSKFYRILSTELFEGYSAAAIIFHRPQGQDFSNFPIPQHVPFLIGTIILKQEIVWAMSIPNRLLLRIGMQSSHFPVPIVNKRNRESVYTDSSENTVLKVFNDFKNWSYRLPRILGSTVEIESGCVVNIYIPKFGLDELKQIIDSNRNMISWCTELTDHPDSHLVAIQNMEDHTFRTEIFTDVDGTRQIIGANFVVIDGSLKNSNEKFLMTIIEDGVVLRFTVEKMEEIVKNLQNCQDFNIDSDSMCVKIMFADPIQPQNKIGALVSPIDDKYLLGHYQYGLTLTRQFRSQILIPNTFDWALRLSTVINADQGKFPIQLQPRYFDICEQIGLRIATTIEQFIRALILSEQRQLCIRLKIESDCVTYETAKWYGLEQEHYMWTSILDDKLIPYLYQLCPMITTQLHIELHFSIISTRLLQNIDY